MAHRSALVLLAPRVHAALLPLHARHLRNLGRKMPSHVTVLFPFRQSVDDHVRDELAGLCGSLAPFTATFADVGRFGRRVVWLRPEPAAAFDHLSGVVLDAFPDCAPYGGRHRRHTPHLSVGSRLTPDVADALATEVVALLPLADHIDSLSLMFETGDGWRHDQSWPLTGMGRGASSRPAWPPMPSTGSSAGPTWAGSVPDPGHVPPRWLRENDVAQIRRGTT